MNERVSINLRLPPDLHEQLKNYADHETRSLNGQIVQMLREAVEARRRTTPNSA